LNSVFDAVILYYKGQDFKKPVFTGCLFCAFNGIPDDQTAVIINNKNHEL
jgi:hypothetical protein